MEAASKNVDEVVGCFKLTATANGDAIPGLPKAATTAPRRCSEQSLT
jgi:hypothetical protein